MRARYYNPEIKRFINQDVVQGTIENGLSLNRYAYSNGNPISYIDPFGLSPLDSEKTGGGIGQWFIDRWTDFKTGFETLTDLDKVKEAFELINEYGTTSEKILAAYSAGFAYVFSAAAVVTTIYTGGYVIKLVITSTGSAITKIATSIGGTAVAEKMQEAAETAQKTYYHVTSKEAAEAIKQTGQLIGKEFKNIYVFSQQPTFKEAVGSGARFLETVVKFTTNAAFEPDTSIMNETIRKIAMVSSNFGPISVSNVQEVGFKLRWIDRIINFILGR